MLALIAALMSTLCRVIGLHRPMWRRCR
jgi:hypothetical protein